MTDLDNLSAAFTELERRADAVAAHRAPAAATGTDAIVLRPSGASRRRFAPVFATAAGVAGVAALAIGITVVSRGGNSPHTAAPAGDSQPAAQSHPVGPSSSATTTATAKDGGSIPQTAAQLADEFRAVLASTPGVDPATTFTITDTGSAVQMTLPGPSSTAPAAGRPNTPDLTVAPGGGSSNGAAIVGVLTSAGVTGGYDLQIFQATPGDRAQCDDPDRSRCSVSTLADGGSLALGREPLEGGGLTYEADLIRTDGVEVLMHVSNARDPKGDSTVLAPKPPLTSSQMTSILTSPGW